MSTIDTPNAGVIEASNLSPSYPLELIMNLGADVVNQFLDALQVPKEQQFLPRYQLISIFAVNNLLTTTISELESLTGPNDNNKYKTLLKYKYYFDFEANTTLLKFNNSYNLTSNGQATLYSLLTMFIDLHAILPNILENNKNIEKSSPVSTYFETWIRNKLNTKYNKINVSTLKNAVDGQSVIQITGAIPGPTPGGEAFTETRTVYLYTPDTDTNATYFGSKWAYVYGGPSSSFNLSPELSLLSIAFNEHNQVIIDGHPVYQFFKDTDPSVALGNDVGQVWYVFPVLTPKSSTTNITPSLGTLTPVQSPTPTPGIIYKNKNLIGSIVDPGSIASSSSKQLMGQTVSGSITATSISDNLNIPFMTSVPESVSNLPVNNYLEGIEISYPIRERRSLDYINGNRRNIYDILSSSYTGDITMVTSPLLTNMFELYDGMFFGGRLSKKITDTNSTMSFEVSGQMTSTAGKCMMRNGCNFTIRMSIPVFTDINPTGITPLYSNGVPCYNRLACLMNVFEHELCHFIVYIYTSKYTAKRIADKKIYGAHGRYFKEIVGAFFGHVRTTHNLLAVPIDENEKLSKGQVRINQLVKFSGRDRGSSDRKIVMGIVTKLNPKRTVVWTPAGIYRPRYESLAYVRDDDEDPIYYQTLDEAKADLKLRIVFVDKPNNSLANLLGSSNPTNSGNSSNSSIVNRGVPLVGRIAYDSGITGKKSNIQLGSYVKTENKGILGYVTDIRKTKVTIIDAKTKEMWDVPIENMTILVDENNLPIIDYEEMMRLYVTDTRSGFSKESFRNKQKVYFFDSKGVRINGTIQKRNPKTAKVKQDGGDTIWTVEYTYIFHQ